VNCDVCILKLLSVALVSWYLVFWRWYETKLLTFWVVWSQLDLNSGIRRYCCLLEKGLKLNYCYCLGWVQLPKLTSASHFPQWQADSAAKKVYWTALIWHGFRTHTTKHCLDWKSSFEYWKEECPAKDPSLINRLNCPSTACLSFYHLTLRGILFRTTHHLSLLKRVRASPDSSCYAASCLLSKFMITTCKTYICSGRHQILSSHFSRT